MGRVTDIGSSEQSTFWYWINERHRIWQKRDRGEPAPWTDDPVLQTYKFTNCFRELDRGTLHLRFAIKDRLLSSESWFCRQDENILVLLLFNIITYRMYNRIETQQYLGLIGRWDKATRKKWLAAPAPVFTGAHMTVGRRFEDKRVTYARTWDRIWSELRELFTLLRHDCDTMESAFDTLLVQDYFGIGKFIAYEIICDLRFTPIGEHWSDTLTWANIGPGCKRGLQRLGLPVHLDSLRMLYANGGDDPDCLQPHVAQHHVGWARWNEVKPKTPLFELREIEHSLCEFDKYERTRRGEGRPRGTFPKGAGG